MSVPSCTNEETDEELKSWHDWVGSRVSISGTKVGILRYFGKTHFAEGSWCGVELDEPVGKNNGTVKDVRYFTCKANFGIFAPLSKTEKITDDSHKTTAPVVHKSKLPQSKGKLKFIPLQSETPKSFNETICLSTAKSHLPCYQINANELKTNIVNEIYKKHHHKPDDFLEKKKESDSYHFNNNNNNNGAFLELGHLKIAERRTSTPVASPFRKSSTDQISDIFNRTTTLDSDEKIYSNQESFGFLTDNCLLNATFDLSNTRILDNAVLVKKKETFVLQNANIFPTDYPRKPSESCIENEEEPKSSELEESLGILSPSQMKDFTLSFDNIGNGTQGLSQIKKNESCDDVNEIPEFEEKILHESSGDLCDVLINIGSEKSLKDIIPSVQAFELINHSDTKGKDADNAKIEDKAKISVDYLEMQTVENLTPKELNKLRDSFSFSDFHHIDDVNLHVVPSATSTPTFSSLKLSKPAPTKSRRCNLISSYIHSSSMEQVVSSTTFNKTFTHCFAEQNSPPPEVNVISKMLIDLDQTDGKESDIKFKTFKLENSECESTSRCLFSDVNQEDSSFNIEGIADNITMSISNVENKQPVLSQTTVLPNSVFSDKELCESFSKSANSKILEGKSTESAVDSPSLLNTVLNSEEAICLASQVPTSLNTSKGASELDELIDANMKEPNCAGNTVYQNNTNHIHQTVSYNSNASDAVTVNSGNKTSCLESEIALNTSEKNEKLANTPTLLEENPVHSTNTNNNTVNCDIHLCQINETKSSSIDESVFTADKNEWLEVSQIEKCDSELEDENTNKLSETFSCSTLKELDNLETQDDSICNEENDNTEARVLDVTMTVMEMDNLNVTIDIDTNQSHGQVPIINQPNSAIHSKNDFAQSNPSLSVKNSQTKEGQHTSNVKKSSDVKSVPSKQPKRNVISKIKHMLESGKSSSANQENQKSKSNGMNENKVGRWDSVKWSSSKTAAGLANKPKKVTSRVDTNLNASRQVITKTPSKPNVNRKAETANKNMASNNLKNSLNSQMACEKSKFTPPVQKVSTEKDLRVLAQLQNVDCDNKQSNKDSKVNLKKKRMGLLSKAAGVLSRSNSLSSACSQTSLASSKIILQAKTSTPIQTKTSTPIQAKGINLKKSESMTPKVDAGLRKAVPPGKSRIGKFLPRRNNTLPILKQQSKPKFQRP